MSGDLYDAELETLRKAISPARADVSSPPAPAPEAVPRDPELLAALQELKVGLTRIAEGADDIIAEHPATSVGAAFLLGLAVGRLMRGL